MDTAAPSLSDMRLILEIIQASPAPITARAIRERYGKRLPKGWQQQVQADPRVRRRCGVYVTYEWVGGE